MLSVLMPAYNAEKYIAAAIDSIVAQRIYTEIEILICDDCSTDNTAQILREKMKSIDGLKVFTLEVNQGVSAARNRLIKEINPKTQYVAFLDSDDVLVPHAYKKALATLNSSIDTQLTISKLRMVPTTFLELGGHLSEEWPILSGINLATCIFRKELLHRIGEFNTSLSYAEDLDYMLRIVEVCKKIAHFEDVVYYYRRHTTNVTLNSKELGEGFRRAIMLHMIRRKKNPTLMDAKGMFRIDDPAMIARARIFHE
jgi:glycosyltransferase involved in cell wall biosynthesis